MRKIKLDPDRLRVDSFATEAAGQADGGTVHGHYSQPGTCDARVGTCFYGGSCGAGCATRQGCTALDCA